MSAVNPVDQILAATPLGFYTDNPGALGSGTYAQSYTIPRGVTQRELMLGSWDARVDFPWGVGEQVILRLYRYRKTAPGGTFSYTQITDAFLFNSDYDWGWTWPLDHLIRSGFDLNPKTDSLAASAVYTSGGSPSVRALRVNFTYKEKP